VPWLWLWLRLRLWLWLWLRLRLWLWLRLRLWLPGRGPHAALPPSPSPSSPPGARWQQQQAQGGHARPPASAAARRVPTRVEELRVVRRGAGRQRLAQRGPGLAGGVQHLGVHVRHLFRGHGAAQALGQADGEAPAAHLRVCARVWGVGRRRAGRLALPPQQQQRQQPEGGWQSQQQSVCSAHPAQGR
jgi:hypothetical protein